MKTWIMILGATLMLPSMASAGPLEDVADFLDENVEPIVFCVFEGEDCSRPCIDTPCGNPCDEQDCEQIIQNAVDFVEDTACDGDFGDCTPSNPCQGGCVPNDSDGDSIPDSVESEICGRAAVRNAINNNPELGKCLSNTNYQRPGTPPTGPIVDFVLETVGGVVEIVDDDNDLVPDAVEPAICSVENENSSVDGECTGNDYDP